MDKKPIYIIGNWKSNKTLSEAHAWFYEFSQLQEAQPLELTSQTHIVLCPPIVYVPSLHQSLLVTPLPLSLGSQDVSGYGSGAYTGEINTGMISDMVKYALVGHSERRKYFQESETLLAQKINQAKEAGITPVYCVQDENMEIPVTCTLVAYEPVWAIGTGKPDTPENADRVAGLIKATHPTVSVIYGGSVTADNVASYISMSHISGVLPGGASLSAASFFRMIQNATKA